MRKMLRGLAGALIPVLAACSAAAGSSQRSAETKHAPAREHASTTTTTTTTSPPPPWRARRVPSAADPLRVLLVGDSVALTLSGAIGIPLEQTGRATFESQAWLGFGLTAGSPGLIEGKVQAGVPNFVVWPERFTAFADDKNPDAVVVLIGAWDVFDRQVFGQWLRPGTPEWRAWYDRLLDDAVRILTSKGAHLYWLTFPCTSTYRNDRVPVVNDAYRAVAARWPDRITLIDLYGEVCPGGRYSATFTDAQGHVSTVRADDGVHFTLYVAGPVLAPWLGNQILPDWGLQ